MRKGARQKIINEFMQAGREYSRLSVMFREAIANAMRLYITDMECLDFLLNNGQATAGQLAKQINLTTGAITSMIRRLEKAGFVKYQKDPKDNRRVIVKPITKNLSAGKKLYDAFGKDLKKLVEKYSEAELLLIKNYYVSMSLIYQNQLRKMNKNENESF